MSHSEEKMWTGKTLMVVDIIGTTDGCAVHPAPYDEVPSVAHCVSFLWTDDILLIASPSLLLKISQIPVSRYAKQVYFSRDKGRNKYKNRSLRFCS